MLMQTHQNMLINFIVKIVTLDVVRKVITLDI